jgi:hypothetical protein
VYHRVVARGDIFKGTAIWCKAMLKKVTNADEALAVDVALQDAVHLIRQAKLDNDRSKADEVAEQLILQLRDALAKTAQESIFPSGQHVAVGKAKPGSE